MCPMSSLCPQCPSHPHAVPALSPRRPPQADIFRADFAAERAAREQLHAQREELQEMLAQLRLRLRGDPQTRWGPPPEY